MKIKLLNFCLLLIILSAPAFSLDRIVDNAGVLSAGEIANLRMQLASISSKYNFDLIIVTERSISGSPEVYADAFFENNGYGFGSSHDGALILQVVSTRDVQVSTSGRGIRILNIAAENKLYGDAVKFLGQGSSYRAFQSFLSNWEEFLSLEANGGRNYNVIHQWNFLITAIAWLFAAAIGFLTVRSWKSRMNTALSQTQAGSYMTPNSLAFKDKRDSFLFSTVTKTPRPKQQQGASMAGRTRTSSSGRSFGGGGSRKY